MAKRKQPEPSPEVEVSGTPSKRRRTRTSETAPTNGVHDGDEDYSLNGLVSTKETTPNKQRTPSKAKRKSAADTLLDEEEQADEGSPTPKANGRTLFSTARRTKAKAKATAGKTTPSRFRADRSAKRKSARALAELQDEDDWDGQVALAKEILAAGEDGTEDDDEDEDNPAGAIDGVADRDTTEQTTEPEDTTTTTPVKTPGKRGRPKGAKNKRSPTPEGDIAPEERYFFQNRAGPPQISSNKFASVKLLNHDEYFEQIKKAKDTHERDRAQLMKLHARSFAQWSFELDQGFGLCLYGYGCKRGLTSKFAEWLYKHNHQRATYGIQDTALSLLTRPPRIVVVNGYTPKLNVRGILNTIAAAVTNTSDDDGDDSDDDEEEDDEGGQRRNQNERINHHRKRLRLVGQPHEMLDTLLACLTNTASADDAISGGDGGGDGGSDGDRDGTNNINLKKNKNKNKTTTNPNPIRTDLIIFINSIDAPPLRRPGIQSLLARLAGHPQIQFLATADTPTFPSLWNSTLLDQFRFVFHDCTTFAPYTAEISVVDEVHELLGRKRLRSGGKEGIGFVLKSLPENARNLYRLLLCEIMEILTDGEGGEGVGGQGHGTRHTTNGTHDHDHDGYSYNHNDHNNEIDDEDNDNNDDDDDGTTRNNHQKSSRKTKKASTRHETSAEQVGVEYRTLYQKASEEFICSSSMNFQFLLKEFHDHQMITSRRDAGGMEVLSVPLERGEMEAVLEDLVV
ncbi:origin recognition complex subunit 2 [Capronia coronata CBS 617.96]|uniref:Origin recognition complex subunit 2 n=1 Tax=Capronia coronata CBS 617.96 TaxID=1182541 RepID=W9Y236_9EURO|nr:origin recognition complex subunit 2 [Capronia coronata CBS 617.96]EXJ83715.1 origin recognition complex subunit 2 [Capronia coronata CBS 617.96]